MRNKLLLIVLVLMLPLGSQAQSDSTILSFDRFLQLVKANHPASKQAELVRESGDANLKRARGSFDPILKSTYDQKQFDDKNYFQLNKNELSIPTAIGLQLKAGYENNQGLFVNPENRLPTNGLAYAGIALPLGSGLLFDERRQEVRAAEVMQRSTELERVLLLNNLVFEASKAYWNWYSAWNNYNIFSEAVDLAEFRFNGIRESFLHGELPAIDTLEAFILVQNRMQNQNDAFIKMQKAMMEVSNYLWSEELQPLNLTDKARPDRQNLYLSSAPIEAAYISTVLEQLETTHPKMLLMYNKLESLDIERRLKAEKVKPKINVNYNMLSQPVGGNPIENYSANNYKWGFEFSMPILLRKGRGDLQLTKIKINQTGLELEQQNLSIKNKIRAYELELNNLYSQIQLMASAVENYKLMLAGEKRKFEEGESSLFVVNSRESKLIEAEIKLISILAKYQKSKAGLQNAIGTVENIS